MNTLANLLDLTYNVRMMTQRVSGTLTEEDASRLFSRLDRIQRPDVSDLDLLMRHSLRFAELGYARKGRDLIAKWQENGCKDPDLALVRNSLIFAVPSSAAIHRMKAISSMDVGVAASDVNHHVYRGELKRAIEIAQAHAWFLESHEYVEGVLFALQAMALLGKMDEAQSILDSWKKRYAQAFPEKTQMVLRFESRLAYWRYQYSRELDLLLDAQALCRHLGLDAAAAYTEPDIVRAMIHCGQMDQARSIIDSWADSKDSGLGPLLGFRNRTRMIFALFDKRYSEAEKYGQRILDFYNSIGNATLVSSVLFFLVLLASRDSIDRRLSAFRSHAYRYQIPFFLDRLKTMERVMALTGSYPREILLRESFSQGSRQLPLWRMWIPSPESLGSGIYVDRFRGISFIFGKGPLTLRTHPVLNSILDQILSRPDFRVSIPDLFGSVWGGVYNPVIHEGKVHVSIHRLRSWIEKCCPDSNGLVEVRDQVVGIRPGLDVRVVNLHMDEQSGAATMEVSSSVDSLGERVLQCLSHGGSVAPGDLQRLLGVGRTSLGKVLRHLLSQAKIQRIGRGRSVRYMIRMEFGFLRYGKPHFKSSKEFLS